eukprot:2317997-Rhodomonas_salina.3
MRTAPAPSPPPSPKCLPMSCAHRTLFPMSQSSTACRRRCARRSWSALLYAFASAAGSSGADLAHGPPRTRNSARFPCCALRFRILLRGGKRRGRAG